MRARTARTWIAILAFLGTVGFVACGREPSVVVVESAPAAAPVASPVLVDASGMPVAETVRALAAFVAEHPDDARAAAARKRIEELRQDDTPWLRARANSSLEALDAFLADFPGHAREGEARELRKRLEPRSVFDLLAEGAVEVTARGAGIERMSLELRRRVPQEIAVAIPVGTFFVTSGGAQNMVATRASVVRLRSDAPTEATVQVACANRTLPIPHAQDDFHLEVAPHVEELRALAPVLERANASVPVAQAAVWIVTDDADYAALGLLVLSIDGFSGSRVIDEVAAVTALKLCADAGVDVATRKIGADDGLLVTGLGLSAQGIDEWCRGLLERRGYGRTPGEIVLAVLERAEDETWAVAAQNVAKGLARSVREAGPARLATVTLARTRVRACHLYETLADPADLELVLALARDADVEVRAGAIDALSAFPAETAFDALTQALADPDDIVVSAATLTIEAKPDPRHVAPLLALARSSHANWARSHALEVAAHLAGTSPEQAAQVQAALAEALRGEDETLVYAALGSLTPESARSLVSDVIAAMRRIDDANLRSNALYLLQRADGPEARAEILRCTGDPDPIVGEAAFSCLARLPMPELASVLEGLLAANPDAIVRQRVAHTIAYVSTPEVRTLLRRLADDPDAGVRVTAVAAMQGWAEPADLDLLVRRLDDEEPEVRAAALRVPAPFADDRWRAAVVKALTDTHEEVAIAALQASGRLPGATVVPVIEAGLASGDQPNLHAFRVNALVAIGTREAAAALWRVQARTQDLEQRIAWIAEFATIADESFVAPLAEAAGKEANPGARAALEAASKALRERLDAARPRR